MRTICTLLALLLAACSEPAPSPDTGPGDTGADTAPADTYRPPEDTAPLDRCADATPCPLGTVCVPADGTCVPRDAGPRDTPPETATDASDVADVPPADVPDPCDQDRDGHRSRGCGGDDCNDSLAYVHPGAMEHCDGADENCDGIADALADGQSDPLATANCGMGPTPPTGWDRAPVRCVVPSSPRPVNQCPAFTVERAWCQACTWNWPATGRSECQLWSDHDGGHGSCIPG